MDAAKDLTLRVNGEARTVPGPMTVAQLLAHLGVEARQVAVERNRAIVRRAEHGSTVLADGDELEIVTFVGGG
jgi:thiamine biosynthesis protein ThiS